MQMGILRFWLIEVDRTQTHIVDQSPVAAHGFDITAELIFAGVLFDQLVNGDRLVERFAASIGGVIFGKRVDGESLSVDLFSVTQDSAVSGNRPIKSAMFRVVEVINQIVVG